MLSFNGNLTNCAAVYTDKVEWYDSLISGLVGVGMGFGLDVASGFAMPFLTVGDYIFGTNGAQSFNQMLNEAEYNVKSEYVKDDTWYYGGKIFGHALAFVYGLNQMISGVKLIEESGIFIFGGIAAAVTGVGAPVGGAAMAVAGATAVAGAVMVVAGTGTVTYSIGNMGSDVDKFVDSLNKDSYYKKGLKDIPDDWIEVEAPEEYPVKSDSFKEFLKSQGENPKKWKKVVEKWASPDGTIYQRHYWTNGKDYYYHGDGIEEYNPH